MCNRFPAPVHSVIRGHAHCKISGAVRILATSLRHQTQNDNTDSTSYASLVDAASLSTRSTCKLVWDWPDILPNWSVIFSGQSMEDTIPDMEYETKQYAYFVSL